MTRAFWVLVFTLLGILFLGLVSLQGTVLLLLLPLLVYLGAAILRTPAAPRLQLERSLSRQRLVEGEGLQVRIDTLNEGTDLEEICLAEQLPPGLKLVAGSGYTRARLPGQGRLHLEYSLQPRRGKYVFESFRVQTGDELGLFQHTQLVALPESLTVLPPSRPLRQFQIRPRQTRGFAGPISARRGGSGSDFFGLREYQPGDPTRRINWLVSSRHEEALFTNEFEQEAIADVGLILDARLGVNRAAGGLNIFEHSVSVAATLAETLLQQGHRVSLLSFGLGLQRVFPGYGKVQLQRILSLLANLKPGRNFALDSLRSLPTRLFSANSQLILITPLAFEDREALIGLVAQGYQVMVLSPRLPAEMDETTPGILPQARRLREMEFHLLIRNLKRVGVQVVEWPVETPLEGAIRGLSWQSIPLRRLQRAKK